MFVEFPTTNSLIFDCRMSQPAHLRVSHRASKLAGLQIGFTGKFDFEDVSLNSPPVFLLEIEQSLLAPDAAGITAQRTVGPDHAVTRNHNRQLI